jgi:wyosine [tRNA(Phe)-imidazoG37] synthetase (radical SAM superfamily)
VNIVEFEPKQLQGQYCLSPFVSISVDISGQVSLCGCSDWQPTKIGNIFDHSIQELLGGELAQQIRASISDGSYRYCNEKTCGIINNNQLNYRGTLPPEVVPLIDDSSAWIMPSEIVLAGDLTCNLSCPSCRKQVIRLQDQERQQQIDLGQLLADNLFGQPSNRPINLTLSTSGEIFASSFLMQFVSSIDTDNFPGLNLRLQTNGLLAPANWKKLGRAADHVSQVTVTFDASTADTYQLLRRGGDWQKLLASLEFFQDLKKTTGMRFHTRMVAQQANWREIVEFYDLSREYTADRVEYVRLTDWGTYGSEFASQDVFDPVHPEHHQAQELLTTVSKRPFAWFGGDLHANK